MHTKAQNVCFLLIILTSLSKLKIKLLHIKMSKSCFIDFKSKKNSLPNEELNVLIQNIEIKPVTEAKFLEVTIDENLNWNSHLKKLYKKLSCSTGILNTIKDNIPDDLHLKVTSLMV